MTSIVCWVLVVGYCSFFVDFACCTLFGVRCFGVRALFLMIGVLCVLFVVRCGCGSRLSYVLC